jgi:hypothetical protein
MTLPELDGFEACWENRAGEKERAIYLKEYLDEGPPQMQKHKKGYSFCTYSLLSG